MAIDSKMSEIMKNLAMLCFRDTKTVPSSEAVHASLLLANVAWNRALGREVPDYEDLLMVFTRSKPELWSELRSGKTEALIESMCMAKEQLYPMDRRVVLICGMRESNIRVEWCDEKDYPEASALAKMRIAALSEQYAVPLQHSKNNKKK
ncbi:MAG: hypothetical protein PHQ58_19630 [Rhodoferax sp.]|uniref:hypothetical protein n=1 Tax=Rhodoferax sp. TaxID=50421 RepID=UPI00262B5C15|nr:hypothetical protein [Rhodoferax sp.]MDD2882638.1 hypothetical protein [Rhodoferax sp.]